jgi:hypothetical protein
VWHAGGRCWEDAQEEKRKQEGCEPRVTRAEFVGTQRV